MDFEVQRCSRHCAATERELKPGEEYYSVLIDEGANVERYDYSKDAWSGPPENTVAWWKSKIPDRVVKKKQWAPNDVMLQFFEELVNRDEQADMRYVLSLLLVRRRVLRQEESETDEDGNEVLVLYSPKRETTYKLHTAIPDESRINEIQDELAKLLE
ncbi:MAG: hypothetical protein JXM70_15920 [Pirellulales bacterium]|nr:hypothetical protein [Pirellulales bacterium]